MGIKLKCKQIFAYNEYQDQINISTIKHKKVLKSNHENKY